MLLTYEKWKNRVTGREEREKGNEERKKEERKEAASTRQKKQKTKIKIYENVERVFVFSTAEWSDFGMVSMTIPKSDTSQIFGWVNG